MSTYTTIEAIHPKLKDDKQSRAKCRTQSDCPYIEILTTFTDNVIFINWAVKHGEGNYSDAFLSEEQFLQLYEDIKQTLEFIQQKFNLKLDDFKKDQGSNCDLFHMYRFYTEFDKLKRKFKKAKQKGLTLICIHLW